MPRHCTKSCVIKNTRIGFPQPNLGGTKAPCMFKNIYTVTELDKVKWEVYLSPD